LRVKGRGGANGINETIQAKTLLGNPSARSHDQLKGRRIARTGPLTA